ncbi:MAG: hypothetical protein IJ831_01365, partial [Spirochaetales bacterium]|nr:hypothetical protein [Spirochaetales bacterium]
MELKKKKGFRVATYALVILAIFLVVFFTSCGKKDKGSTAPASQAAPAASAPASAPAAAAPAPAPAPAAPAPAPA